MSFYVFLCVSFLPLSFWRTRGLTWLKALLAFKYPLEPGIFFFWVEGGPSRAFFYYLVQ